MKHVNQLACVVSLVIPVFLGGCCVVPQKFAGHSRVELSYRYPSKNKIHGEQERNPIVVTPRRYCVEVKNYPDFDKKLNFEFSGNQLILTSGEDIGTFDRTHDKHRGPVFHGFRIMGQDSGAPPLGAAKLIEVVGIDDFTQEKIFIDSGAVFLDLVGLTVTRDTRIVIEFAPQEESD